MLLRCCRCCITTNTTYFLHFNQISNNIYNLNLFNPHTYNLRRRCRYNDDDGDDGDDDGNNDGDDGLSRLVLL